MMLFTKDNLEMVKEMDSELWNIHLVVYMKEAGMMIKEKEKDMNDM